MKVPEKINTYQFISNIYIYVHNGRSINRKEKLNYIILLLLTNNLSIYNLMFKADKIFT